LPNNNEIATVVFYKKKKLATKQGHGQYLVLRVCTITAPHPDEDIVEELRNTIEPIYSVHPKALCVKLNRWKLKTTFMFTHADYKWKGCKILVLFIRLIICLFQLVFSVRTVFFSQKKKSDETIFQPAYQHSRMPPLNIENIIAHLYLFYSILYYKGAKKLKNTNHLKTSYLP
jgi:hypothetical protein